MSAAERAAAERAAQGLPTYVEDDAVLDRIAALLDLAGTEEYRGGGPVESRRHHEATPRAKQHGRA